MNSGMVFVDKVMSLALDQIVDPDGVLSIFAGGVFWESVEKFEHNCIQNTEHSLDKLLEMRVYSKECEFHAVRDSINRNRMLSWRVIEDSDFGVYEDEVQFLDIDKSWSGSSDHFSYKTMSGGCYTLPVENAAKIKLRNYYDYDEDGLEHFVDFRIVCLLREGEE